jgi:hypothetical protein
MNRMTALALTVDACKDGLWRMERYASLGHMTKADHEAVDEARKALSTLGQYAQGQLDRIEEE